MEEAEFALKAISLLDEYKLLFKTISAFDDRLLIIKGWAVSFTLATLVLAIQQKSRNLYFVVIEAKLIGEPDIDQCFKEKNTRINTVLTDWTWRNPTEANTKIICLRDKPDRYTAYFYPHIFIPYVFIIVFSLVSISRRRLLEIIHQLTKPSS